MLYEFWWNVARILFRRIKIVQFLTINTVVSHDQYIQNSFFAIGWHQSIVYRKYISLEVYTNVYTWGLHERILSIATKSSNVKWQSTLESVVKWLKQQTCSYFSWRVFTNFVSLHKTMIKSGRATVIDNYISSSSCHWKAVICKGLTVFYL